MTVPNSYVEHDGSVLKQHIDEHQDPETGKITQGTPPPEPVTTRRLNLGTPEVHEEVVGPDTHAHRVRITTWASEVVEGVLVDETEDAFVVDQTPKEVPEGRIVKRVPRAAVMSIEDAR